MSEQDELDRMVDNLVQNIQLARHQKVIFDAEKADMEGKAELERMVKQAEKEILEGKVKSVSRV